MKTVTVTLPASFASYLINNDCSSIDVMELAYLRSLLSEGGLRPADCISCDGETFYTNAFGDSLEFTFRAATTDSWAEMMAAARELEAESK